MNTRGQASSGVVGRVTPCAPTLANKKTARRGLARPTGITIFLLMLGLVTALHAQSYTIDWYKIAGGGGTSTGGVYSVSGTIGQPDASGAMTGGSYSLTGGFWSLISVVQTAGLPNLIITQSGNSVIVSWPNTSSCTLQQNNDLAVPGGWSPSGYHIDTSNGTNSVTITPPAGNLFFRLSK
jgi:hypothetical protein